MKRFTVALAMLMLVAYSQCAAQTHDASHGGAAAVNPGGSTAADRGQPESRGEQHAEAAAKQGEGHEEAELPNEVWWKWANFAILAIALGYLISKYAGPFFQTRSESIQRGIEEATRTRQEAEARAAEIERRVANLSAEIEHIRTQSREEMAREGERLRAEAEAQVRKIQAQAEAEIASAAKHATHDLKAYSARLAVELAEKQLQGRLTQPAQDQLADNFVSELRAKAVRN